MGNSWKFVNFLSFSFPDGNTSTALKQKEWMKVSCWSRFVIELDEDDPNNQISKKKIFFPKPFSIIHPFRLSFTF